MPSDDSGNRPPNLYSPAFFAADYRRARSRFLAAAAVHGALIESHPVAGSGPDGEILSMDVARFGPAEPRTLIAVSSGVHGAEGFAGSAVQLQLIHHQLDPILARPGLGLLLVHAVNPHGFAWRERVTGNNVDLNRNFCEHPQGHAANPGYDELNGSINPVELTPESDARARDALKAYAARHGQRALQSAVAGGQYNHPKGLYYGGTAAEPSNRRMREIARRHTATCRRAAWIDVHTGLGRFGEVSLITDFAPASDVGGRVQRWYGSRAQSTQQTDGSSTVTNGSVDTAVLWELPSGCEGTLVTAEFGTYDSAKVFWALRARNWLRHYGNLDSDQGRRIADDACEAFCPGHVSAQNPDALRWRETVLRTGADVIALTLKGLEG